MTLSAIVTMAVALSALGGVLIMRQAINKASIQWKGGVEMAIFLQPNVSANETAAIGHELASTPGVKKFHFVDKPQAYQEFKEIFGNNNDIVGVLGVNDMPPSYRVVPTRAQDISELGKQFQGQPGVLQVSYAAAGDRLPAAPVPQLRLIGYFLAFGVVIGAVALIVNTIQLAIFARRREVAVMKLVGATNWFIRVPFMLEGLIHGIVGAVVAFAVTYAVRDTIASFVGNETVLGITTALRHLPRGDPDGHPAAGDRGGGRGPRLLFRGAALPGRLTRGDIRAPRRGGRPGRPRPPRAGMPAGAGRRGPSTGRGVGRRLPGQGGSGQGVLTRWLAVAWKKPSIWVSSSGRRPDALTASVMCCNQASRAAGPIRKRR